MERLHSQISHKQFEELLQNISCRNIFELYSKWGTWTNLHRVARYSLETTSHFGIQTVYIQIVLESSAVYKWQPLCLLDMSKSMFGLISATRENVFFPDD